jgi:subfamily B ATP-binding cassette protein MsbA
MRLYLRLLSYLSPYKKQFVLAIICMLFLAVFSGASLGVIAPFMKVLFSQPEGVQTGPFKIVPSADIGDLLMQLKNWFMWWLTSGGRISGIAKLCWVILAVFLVKNLFNYLQRLLTVYIEQHITMDIRNQMYGHLQQLSLGYFQRNKVGQLVSRMTNDVNLVRGAITEGSLSIMRQSFQVLVYLAIVIISAWRLSFIAMLILPGCLLLITLIGRRLRKRGRRLQERIADLSAIVAENVSGIRLVKTFATEGYEKEKFEKSNREYYRTIFKFETMAALSAPLTEYMGALVGVLIIWVAKDYIAGVNAIGPERFFVFLAAAFSMIQPLNGMAGVNSSIQHGLAAAERIFALLSQEPEIVDSPDAVQVGDFKRNIHFQNVSFKYDDGQKSGEPENVTNQEDVLKDIELEIRQGEMLALVGPSGAGKSTLVDMIPRFYDPTKGTVFLDGRDIRDLNSKSLRMLMGIVGQETILFHDTVFNNIAYGKQDATQRQVEEAARAANAHQFISQMPETYQTVIGERGVRLSGGERQRISIARAILKNPPILIFDEATSALDAQSEALVQQAIDNLMANRTAIVIAHRLSTVQRADRIVVLDKGRIVETGKHQDLLNKKGIYWKLYNLQFNK